MSRFHATTSPCQKQIRQRSQHLRWRVSPSWILLPVVFALPALVQAQFDYTTNNGAITIIRYSGTSPYSEVTIPSTTNGFPVTSIGDFAFASITNVISVTIPEGVTSIGNSAFQSCSTLTSVTIPIGVTNIGDAAFEYDYYLTKITIPNTVTKIGMRIFATSGLTVIYFLGNAPGVDSTAFYGVNNVTVYYLPGTTG